MSRPYDRPRAMRPSWPPAARRGIFNIETDQQADRILSLATICPRFYEWLAILCRMLDNRFEDLALRTPELPAMARAGTAPTPP